MELPERRSEYVIAVASGKGGVGKSTIAVNLAITLAQMGAAVGLLDADIHGPNIPRMMGVAGQPQQGPDGTMTPLYNYGVALMSVGFLARRHQAGDLAWSAHRQDHQAISDAGRLGRAGLSHR